MSGSRVTRAHVIHGRGGRKFTDAERDTIIRTLEEATRTLTVENLEDMTEVDGRAVREIISQLDGVLFIIAGGEKGYRLARYYEDAARATRSLRRQIATMTTRVERREQYAAGMDRRQGELL